jgi:hypothetical protein
MDFRLADTFTDALARLPANDQKAVKVSVLDLQLDPSAPGLQMHRIDKSKDANFWSARVNRDIRLILHKTAASILVAYVDHHDKAYAWAERRRIEAHPRTGAIQIVEVRERVEEAEPDLARLWTQPDATPTPQQGARPLFESLTDEALLDVGVPTDWLAPVRVATEESFFEIAGRLPSEAQEALLEFAATGTLPAAPAPPEDLPVLADPYAHPDARRRFLTVESIEELQAALDAPWDKWSIFLHPSQRAVVERRFNGPSRVAGTAGTGKTVVALHRAARALRLDPQTRVLLTTFSEPLAASLLAKMKVLLGEEHSPALSRLTVASFQAMASDLFVLTQGLKPRVATESQVRAALDGAATDQKLKGFSPRFLFAEWSGVVDAWRVADAEDYANVPRLGRKNRLGARQREALWPVFAAAMQALDGQGLVTWAQVFHRLADHYEAGLSKPYTHIIVDEAQDLGVPELRLMAAIAPQGGDALFFAGDLGQRIFQQPFSWKALGADVRGRSATLKVNYRTSQQIRQAADRLLPGQVRDVDGREEDRTGAISVFEGPAPDVLLFKTAAAEEAAVGKHLREQLEAGLAASEIGVFVRSRRELPRAWNAVTAAGAAPVELSERADAMVGKVMIGTMHLAKGLEFKSVVVMACDEDVLPLAERIDSVVEESDLDDVFETERHLLYVACTRARDRLLITGVAPGSEFLMDMETGG